MHAPLLGDLLVGQSVQIGEDPLGPYVPGAQKTHWFNDVAPSVGGKDPFTVVVPAAQSSQPEDP